MKMSVDRRAFLKRSIGAALGGASLYSALGNLQLVQAAAALKGGINDYRALVCVFLYGGNDGFNTIVPMTGDARAQYAQGRPTLALRPDQLLRLTPVNGAPGSSDGQTYGIQSALVGTDTVGTSGMRRLFDSGRLAIVPNVGTLVRPTTKAEYGLPGHALPPQLFSHNDQQSYWQTSRADQTLGWAGRMADLLRTANADQTLPMSITISGESILLRGAQVAQFAMNPDPRGVEAIAFVEGGGAETARRRAAFDQLMQAGAQRANLLERTFASATRQTLDNYGAISAALAQGPQIATPFPDTILGRQLRMIARMISVRSALGMQRQVFFVSVPGFDTHDSQIGDHPALLSDVSRSMTAFYDATVELGVSSAVTSFTASDFGRTLSSNGDGSDHGWGSHHFVVGDAVRGGGFWGTMPNLSSGGPDDVGWGQVLPSTSVDQYAATLGRWFGLDSPQLHDVFPNLANFASEDLGFMG